jgi:hypothetical protein
MAASVAMSRRASQPKLTPPQTMLSRLFHAIQPRLRRSPGYFALYGMDTMLDADLHMWFIEMNYSPQLSDAGASQWKRTVRTARASGSDPCRDGYLLQ